MTGKRFTETVSTGVIIDNLTDKEYDCEMRIDDEFLRLVNSIVMENEKLKQENQGIQDKVMRLLDYVEIKQCVTRTEIKKWWNGD